MMIKKDTAIESRSGKVKATLATLAMMSASGRAPGAAPSSDMGL